MEITYIGHSGFLIEWESCYMLFDYYIGDIPEMNPEKKLLVFASHNHADHFNPEIFRLCDTNQDVEYVLSSDIKWSKSRLGPEKTVDEMSGKISSVRPNNTYELYDGSSEVIVLKTLKSTDAGVAFLLHYKDKTIYHAGDLNLWVWKGESKQYNNDMTARFNKEMEELKNVHIDIAFVPLDPRQEEYYYLGLESLLNIAEVKTVFPMHFGEKSTVIQQFKKERTWNADRTDIKEIMKQGQKWKIEI